MLFDTCVDTNARRGGPSSGDDRPPGPGGGGPKPPPGLGGGDPSDRGSSKASTPQSGSKWLERVQQIVHKITPERKGKSRKEAEDSILKLAYAIDSVLSLAEKDEIDGARLVAANDKLGLAKKVLGGGVAVLVQLAGPDKHAARDQGVWGVVVPMELYKQAGRPGTPTREPGPDRTSHETILTKLNQGGPFIVKHALWETVLSNIEKYGLSGPAPSVGKGRGR
ncbi:MAG: hypothetical protein V4568_16175 [Pseudomonadota bacterium]